jgi:CheY-like chemotaxis protein
MIKILLLDDDELANELMVFIFDFAGISDYNIFTSGNDALAFLEDCKADEKFPDVIFVDINMPGMNGFEFIRKYEENYKSFSHETRILMLTNSVLANEKKKAAEYESVYAFWNKPLTRERLISLIDLVTSDKV